MSSQQAFTGWVSPTYTPTPTPEAGCVVMNVVLDGPIDGSNRMFSIPINFSDVSVYLNGVKQIRGADFTPLASATGPAYDRIWMTVAPQTGDIPDVLTADIVAA